MCAFVEDIVRLRHCLWNVIVTDQRCLIDVVYISKMPLVDKVQCDKDKANDTRVFCVFNIF